MSSCQPTVLVVEDDALIRMLLSDALTDAGYCVLEAENALKAIAVLSRHTIDALVTDIDMPGGLNGLDLARMVRSHQSNVAVLVVSGGHSLGSGQFLDGARFLSKPYSLDDIISVLAEISVPATDQHFKFAV